MNLRRLASLRLHSLLLLAGTPLLASSLDFPAAVCRIQIGAQATKFTAGSSGQQIMIDGQPAFAGERLNSLMRVNWIVAPADGVGDEYVFIVRRPGQKPKTYSAVFKGGYAQVVLEEKLSIEIED